MFKLHVGGFGTLVVATSLFLGKQVFAKESVYKAVEKRTSVESQPAKSFKSYKEWKQDMINTAQGRLDQAKTAFEQKRNQTAAQGKDPNLLNRIAREELQVSIASELTISDYFIGYINKQSDMSSAIKNISGRLSAEEVAELMSTLAYNYNRNSDSNTKSAADTNPKSSQD